MILQILNIEFPFSNLKNITNVSIMNIENKIKEQRLALALNKNFFGPQGKLSIICQMFGNSIIEDYFGRDQTDLVYGDIEEKNQFETFSEDHTSCLLGYFYDGVNLGNHLEIKYLINENEIKLYYKGYVKYHELSNDLLSYIPEKEWESSVESIFIRSIERLKKVNEEKLQKKNASVEKMQKELIDKIRSKWGDDLI
jgi:hypothetical protein